MKEEDFINPVKAWVAQLVVAEKLCPFARRPLDAGQVRFVATDAEDEPALVDVLRAEIQHLQENPDIETTLVVHPYALTDFPAYNQFLDQVDALLRREGVEGVFQVASFHPEYQFAGTKPGDAENYSNRSPYPMLHLLREESIAAAVESFEHIEEIPERNIRHLREIGASALAERLAVAVFGTATAPSTRMTGRLTDRAARGARGAEQCEQRGNNWLGQMRASRHSQQ